MNYRTPELALRATRALALALAPHAPAAIRVVDNASGDGSAEALRAGLAGERFPVPVELLVSPVNGGFGAGNNLAIRAGLADPEPPDFFYLLNPDAVPEPDAVGELLACCAARPRAGIVGSALAGEDGAPHAAGFRFPSALGELEGGLRLGIASRLLARHRAVLPPSASARPVDWVSGASLLLRREVIERVGLFDEGFFLYFEEVDLCRRARAAGFEVWSAPRARVAHRQAAATGMEDAARRRPAYWFASRRRYLVKHHGRAYAALADALWLLGRASWRLRRACGLATPAADPPRLWRDLLRASLGRTPR